MADEPKLTTQHERALALLNKFWGDKSELGAKVRREAKQMFPDVSIPEDTTDAAVAPIKAEVDDVKAQLKSALDRLAAKEKADSDLQAENDMSVKIAAAVKEFGLTESGRDKMIERMKAQGNFSDAAAAAAYVVSQMPKPQVSNTPSWLPQAANTYGFGEKDEQWAELHRNPEKYFDNQLREFAKDPDKYVAETFGTA